MSETNNNNGGLMSQSANKGKILDPKIVESFVRAPSEPPAEREEGREEIEQYTGVVAPGIQKMLLAEAPPEYSDVTCNTRIPSWLDEELEHRLTSHKLKKKDVITNALMDYLGVRPPHERAGRKPRRNQ